MCMLKLVLYKWHNIRSIINLICICREIYAQIYVYIYTHYLSWLFTCIYIYLYLFYFYEYTYLFIYIYIYIHMSKWDGFCNAAW